MDKTERPEPPRAARPASAGLVPSRRQRWSERLINYALLVLTLTLLTGLISCRLQHYRTTLLFYDEIRSPEFLALTYPKLTEDQIVQLGKAHYEDDRPASSYLFAHERKPPGTVRIGIFGCSFTRGGEVPEGFDFPSLLEKDLAAAGRPNVEVINFGVGSYGIHQSYLLWQYLGTRFDLDYTIFNIFAFHTQRDGTFVQPNNAFGPVHARFVLGDRGFKLVRVLGHDCRQASEIYHRLLPPWRYLRFDRNPPPVLRALLPAGRELPINPFYYADAGEAEMRRIYSLLFERLSTQAKNLIVLCNDQDTCGLRGDLGSKVYFYEGQTARLSWHTPSLYRAPLNHLSAWSNALVARELMMLLTEREGALPILRLESPAAGRSSVASAVVEPLHRSSLVSLNVAGEPVGEIVVRVPGAPGRHLPWAIRDSGVAALLDVSTPKELRFLGLERALREGTKVSMAFEIDGRRPKADLTEVVLQSPLVGRLGREGGRLHARGEGWSLSADPADFPESLTLEAQGTVGKATLLVGEQTLASGLPQPVEPTPPPLGALSYRFGWSPTTPGFLYVRSHPAQVVSSSEIPMHGTLDLTVATEGGTTLVVPIANYSLVSYPLPPPATPLPEPL